MQEIIGNMWDIDADAYCITTNEVIKANGKAVMGAGVALSAVKKFPDCDEYLGHFIKTSGHKVGVFFRYADKISESKTRDLISFPTKNHWRAPSPMWLIRRSAEELTALIEKNRYNNVILPKPGCSNGGLDWEDVKKVIGPILDDRVVIVSL